MRAVETLERTGTEGGRVSVDPVQSMAGVRRVVVFWDYDTQWGADRSRSPGGGKGWGGLDFVETERLLELHAEYGVPACFAVVGAAALAGARPYHDPAQIRRIHDAGHEVASHSHRHEWLPGLGPAALGETVSASKDALEQCIGAEVVTFVPPFNQPFDHPGRLAFSLSERRECRGERTGLPGLCTALRAAGYRLCRVAYATPLDRLRQWLTGSRGVRDTRLERIRGLACLRLRAAGGFRDPIRALEDDGTREGILVVYGHPHSLHSGNSQDEAHLRPFLERVRELQRSGALRVALPRELVGGLGDGPEGRA